jgi:hypothetical protein
MRTLRSRLVAVARVAALLVCMLVSWASILAYWAYARADELIQETGAAMLTYARAQHLDAPRTLLLNGAMFRFVSGSTDDSPRALLDAFQERCKQVGPRLELDARALSKTRRVTLGKLPGFDGSLRHDGTDGGYFACLDTGGKLTPAELRKRLRAFVETRDLATVGDLRFVWAHTDHGRTGYVGVFTQGSVPLGAMFPAHGDAPGQDPPHLPRPMRSRRTLSAWQQDEAPLLSTYAASVSPAALVESYRAQLLASGFAVRQMNGSRALLVTRADEVATAVLSSDGHGGSSIALTRLR